MKLVTTIHIPETQLNQLRDSYPDITICHCHSEKEAQSYLEEADIVLSDHLNFTPESIEKAPRLKWLQLTTAGVENIPFAELAERGITVTNAKGIHGSQMGEYALGMMLAHTRKLLHYRELQKKHQWEGGFIGGELAGKTVTIVGAGAIGSAIAEMCKVFGMNVYGASRSGLSKPNFDRIVKREWEALLTESSFVIVLLPLTPRTKHFIHQEHFAAMPQDCFFINLARGSVVKEADLITALESGQIGGAALDVFEKEPLEPESPLWEMKHVFLTPHIAGNSDHYMERVFRIVLENVANFLANKPLKNQVDLKANY
ncbi:D-2-hydroxyacid dehydrogenase [Alkalihalobacillus oceani]|uniref:D-2-hydroxyacid dehydrogenase n=1 Tax=Halalkalibacter oceani TaxID=1653776 RepID=UPI00203AFED2|nr:D-2-hydroxyacid dehydrogenase [Halalkalibacter oceani]MCM3760395.1 D-2-hydroxyacid dehydrogenase [Halalkalibacter oceani]